MVALLRPPDVDLPPPNPPRRCPRPKRLVRTHGVSDPPDIRELGFDIPQDVVGLRRAGWRLGLAQFDVRHARRGRERYGALPLGSGRKRSDLGGPVGVDAWLGPATKPTADFQSDARALIPQQKPNDPKARNLGLYSEFRPVAVLLADNKGTVAEGGTRVRPERSQRGRDRAHCGDDDADLLQAELGRRACGSLCCVKRRRMRMRQSRKRAYELRHGVGSLRRQPDGGRWQSAEQQDAGSRVDAERVCRPSLRPRARWSAVVGSLLKPAGAIARHGAGRSYRDELRTMAFVGRPTSTGRPVWRRRSGAARGLTSGSVFRRSATDWSSKMALLCLSATAADTWAITLQPNQERLWYRDHARIDIRLQERPEPVKPGETPRVQKLVSGGDLLRLVDPRGRW